MLFCVSDFFPTASPLLLDIVQIYLYSLLCSISDFKHSAIDLSILILMDILLISSLGWYEQCCYVHIFW